MRRLKFLGGLAIVPATLAACSGGSMIGDPAGKGRALSMMTKGMPSDQSTPNPVDPASGLKIIGSVTAHRYPTYNPSMSFDWNTKNIGLKSAATGYVGFVWALDRQLLSCAGTDAANLIGTAAAVATYLQANGSSLKTATANIIEYAQVYLAGGATAVEFLGAAVAVLGAADWAALLATLGLVGYETYRLLNCALDNL